MLVVAAGAMMTFDHDAEGSVPLSTALALPTFLSYHQVHPAVLPALQETVLCIRWKRIKTGAQLKY